METEPKSAAEFLKAGIAAAKAGRRAEARRLLTQVTELDATSATAWLWLSGVVEGPQEQERCLEKVLALDPEHAAARKGLAIVRQRLVENLLLEGIAAVEIGQHEKAQAALLAALERDENNATAWWWMSRVAESAEDCEICLENVLTLAPDHAAAQSALEALRTAQASSASPDVDSDVGVAVKEDEAWSRYQNPYLCPYCGADTSPDDRRCAQCRKSLWIKIRRREKRSTLLWVVMGFQALNVIGGAAAFFVILAIVGFSLGISDFTQLLPLYFGGQSQLPPEIAALVVQIIPPWAAWLSILPFLFSLALLVALYLRWAPVYYLLLVNAGINLLISVLSLFLIDSAAALIGGVIGILASLGVFVLVLNLQDDFIHDKKRLLLQIDRDAADGTDYLARGRLYASHGMWTAAAIHLRYAAAMMPEKPAGHIALAEACLELGDRTLAERALENAKRLVPDLPRVRALAARFEAGSETGLADAST
ncbi:MAG: tetratricopeptide repeat protein [Anaerolineae bacterium]|nr:tetratricopeptide repeat protein [Anaerolineae bacterium]